MGLQSQYSGRKWLCSSSVCKHISQTVSNAAMVNRKSHIVDLLQISCYGPSYTHCSRALTFASANFLVLCTVIMICTAALLLTELNNTEQTQTAASIAVIKVTEKHRFSILKITKSFTVNAVVRDEDELQFIVRTHWRLWTVENLSVEAAASLTVTSHDLWMKSYTGAFWHKYQTELRVSNYGCCNVNNLTIWTIFERFSRWPYYAFITVVINFVACCYNGT